MVRKFLRVFVLLILILAVSCQSPESGEVAPTPTYTPQSVAEEIDFNDPKNELTAYNRPGFDKTFTPLELYEAANGKEIDKTLFPLIVPVLLDKNDKPVRDLGLGGKALLVGEYAIGFSLDDFSEFKPNDLPPPDRDKHPGFLLVYDISHGGSFDGEVLGEVVAQSEDFPRITIFKRDANAVYPFPDSLPFELGSIKDISLADRVVLYGYTSGIFGEYSLTEKRGAVSAIDFESGIFRINGTVTPKDSGSPVFIVDCGRQALSAVTFGSLKDKGRENEAFTVDISRIAEFFEKETGTPLKTKESEVKCLQENTKITKALVEKMSDGEYDSSFDMAHLKESDFDGILKWVRPIEGVIAIEKNPEKLPSALMPAVLLDDYALVSASAVSPDPTQSDNRYRILWGDFKSGAEAESFEYVKFADYDHTGTVALFKRDENTKFPKPDGLEFKVGSSFGLKYGFDASVLYAVGFSRIADASRINAGINPLVVAKHSARDAKAFYFQGSLSQNESGAALFAIRDGEFEWVGFDDGPMNFSKSETMRQARRIEYILDALDPSRRIQGGVRGEGFNIIPEISKSIAKILVATSAKDKDGNEIKEIKFGEAVILSDKYALSTSALFPQTAVSDELGNVKEGKSDITSNAQREAITVDAVIFKDFFREDEVVDFLENGEGEEVLGVKIEILKVKLLDRENGYALLERTITKLEEGDGVNVSLYGEEISNIDIVIPHLEVVFESGGEPKFVDIATHGRIVYNSNTTPIFIFNGFVGENLGAPIYDKKSGKLLGIIYRADPQFPKKIDTEGLGLSMKFITEKIKEKTGIDIFE